MLVADIFVVFGTGSQQHDPGFPQPYHGEDRSRFSIPRMPQGVLIHISFTSSTVERCQRRVPVPTVVSLPYDVHVEILDWVYRSSQHLKVDYEAFRACALVCKAWTAPAQRLLFRVIYSPNLTPALLDALQHNALLGTYVRFIEISICGSTLSTWPFTNDAEFALLALCPKLSALSLHVIGEPFDTISLVERMRGLCPLLKHLELHVDQLQCTVPFVGLWPDLQSIKLYNPLDQPGVSGTTPPLKTPGRAAVDLRFHDTARWLLEAADTSALRELEVSEAYWGNPLYLGAFKGTPALKNLTSLLLDRALPPQDVIDCLVRLETLVFALYPPEDVVLPRTLRHVGYHATTRNDFWRDPIPYLLRALQGLPVLSLLTVTRELIWKDLERLERACEDMHVDFELYRDPPHA
ncbi:hypothetical protein FA95DRAFT_1611949 [Auriscalpium vulgare]|uniref:Uncharacterized protein n=1 Tax=Auriscalpium vulgare TaxID=40419 RepID=A0ACB8R7W5_9AGAM|nr:hypothetical protein FA95DRAFT_1611949 [Auriscalpium vulgare]